MLASEMKTLAVSLMSQQEVLGMSKMHKPVMTAIFSSEVPLHAWISLASSAGLALWLWFCDSHARP